MVEPEKILADIADVRSVVTVPAPTGVLPRGSDASVVSKLPTLPLRQVAIDCVSRSWRKQLDVCERAPRKRKHTQEYSGQCAHGAGWGSWLLLQGGVGTVSNWPFHSARACLPWARPPLARPGKRPSQAAHSGCSWHECACVFAAILFLFFARSTFKNQNPERGFCVKASHDSCPASAAPLR